jgi:hypothetical protein
MAMTMVRARQGGSVLDFDGEAFGRRLGLQHVGDAEFRAGGPGLLHPLLQQFLAGHALHAAVVLHVGLVQAGLDVPTENQHRNLGPGRVNGGLKAGRPGSQDDHVVGFHGDFSFPFSVALTSRPMRRRRNPIFLHRNKITVAKVDISR